MAHKLMENLIKGTELEYLEVDSAGTAAMPYYAIVGDLRTVMDENGINYTGHIPQMIDRDILESSDLILVMTKGHKSDIEYRFPAYGGKVYLLSEYAEGRRKDIPDPIGMGVESYRETFKMIRFYVEELIERLKNELKD
ncbi:MAG: low molecular weight protein arginine phosphatase [Elusimicrobia bacterium]|nr:low molecular weight protein arginine phosphatase [Elusimicrobiota bacterium]